MQTPVREFQAKGRAGAKEGVDRGNIEGGQWPGAERGGCRRGGENQAGEEWWISMGPEILQGL